MINVGKQWRKNPLAFEPGGVKVKVIYHSGRELCYDNIKNPGAYIRKVTRNPEVKCAEIMNENINFSRPIKTSNPDLSKLYKLCEEYFDFMLSEKYHDDNDFSHYIYEETLTTLYGKDVFKNFINKKS